MLGPRVLTVSDVDALADVEPREVLLAKLAGGFQAPLVKAAGLFQAFTRNMAYGIKALIDTLPATEESGSETAASAAPEEVESDHKSEEGETPAPAETPAEPETDSAEPEETTGEAN
jgi:large subunit ribosomal protein L10